ncbi:MAG: DUF3099 domain-containing protein [Nocardioidaceae bacterium]|nr:DUF3099 domain-containing protein [Nocardioidaceae bacterium]
MEHRRADRTPAPVSITSARTPRSEDISGRQTRYVISMLIRTACFVSAVFADGVLRWALVAGAVFLPYVAVVLANAGVQKDPPPPDTFTAPGRTELGSVGLRGSDVP